MSFLQYYPAAMLFLLGFVAIALSGGKEPKS